MSVSSNETAISRRIRDALTAAGFVVFRVHSGEKHIGRFHIVFAPRGTPDICGYDPRDGKFIGLEVKDLAKATDEQLAFLGAARRAGCKVGIVHSVKEAMEVLNGQDGN